ncbi:hypothetical protein DMA11_15310 [Marinilabiliaceae bacterium JC017]|nr:hypothetical protein DMA11_15310 [Marinilabiliaceae bacterium JC017]
MATTVAIKQKPKLNQTGYEILNKGVNKGVNEHILKAEQALFNRGFIGGRRFIWERFGNRGNT